LSNNYRLKKGCFTTPKSIFAAIIAAKMLFIFFGDASKLKNS